MNLAAYFEVSGLAFSANDQRLCHARLWTYLNLKITLSLTIN